MHALGFKSAAVDVVEPPVCCFAYNWCAIVVTQIFVCDSLFLSALKDPLPDGVIDNAETDGVG
jgi:hypothetical protein